MRWTSGELHALAEKHCTDKAIHDYLDAYELFLSHVRHRKLRLVEIGVQDGGSLRMWKEYFPQAQIIGIDNDPRCAIHEEERIRVFIGSQADRDFLQRVAAEAGPFEIVIDDGGHHMDEQQISFESLFPALCPGGLYVIEDLQTSFMPEFKRPFRGQTTVEFLTGLVDAVNFRGRTVYGNRQGMIRQLREQGEEVTVHEAGVAGISFFNCICFITKAESTARETDGNGQ